MIDPFANNHQSMQIGNLVIENQTDKVTIYGDIDIHLNDEGHEQAKRLHALTSHLLKAFENKQPYSNMDSESRQMNDAKDKDIDNPFL